MTAFDIVRIVMPRKKFIKGVSLIEIIIAIALVAILAVTIIAWINPARIYDNARDGEVRSYAAILYSGIQQYKLDHNGNLPTASGNSLPIVTSSTLYFSGTQTNNLDNFYPDYMAADPSEVSTNSFYIGRIDNDQVVIGGLLSNGNLYIYPFKSEQDTSINPFACTINYNVTTQWSNGFNADITIVNNGTNQVDSWILTWSFTGDQVITNNWNSSVTQTGQSITAQNLSYNGTILGSGGTQSFGIQGSYSNYNTAPVSMILNGQICQINSTGTQVVPTPGSLQCNVNYSVTNQWVDGFTTTVTITNQGSSNITNWQVTWTFPGDQNITSFWNTSITQTGQNISAQNLSYNGTITSGGGTQSFGFNASYSGSNSPLASNQFQVNGVTCQ